MEEKAGEHQNITQITMAILEVYFWTRYANKIALEPPHPQEKKHKEELRLQEEMRENSFPFNQVQKIWKNVSNNRKPQIIIQITKAAPEFK